MKIIITHDESTIDPAATYTPDQFPAVRESLEREYTKELLKAFPEAEVCFQSGSGFPIQVDDYELRSAVQSIVEDVWDTGNFWL